MEHHHRDPGHGDRGSHPPLPDGPKGILAGHLAIAVQPAGVDRPQVEPKPAGQGCRWRIRTHRQQQGDHLVFPGKDLLAALVLGQSQLRPHIGSRKHFDPLGEMVHRNRQVSGKPFLPADDDVHLLDFARMEIHPVQLDPPVEHVPAQNVQHLRHLDLAHVGHLGPHQEPVAEPGPALAAGHVPDPDQVGPALGKAEDGLGLGRLPEPHVLGGLPLVDVVDQFAARLVEDLDARIEIGGVALGGLDLESQVPPVLQFETEVVHIRRRVDGPLDDGGNGNREGLFPSVVGLLFPDNGGGAGFRKSVRPLLAAQTHQVPQLLFQHGQCSLARRSSRSGLQRGQAVRLQPAVETSLLPPVRGQLVEPLGPDQRGKVGGSADLELVGGPRFPLDFQGVPAALCEAVGQPGLVGRDILVEDGGIGGSQLDPALVIEPALTGPREFQGESRSPPEVPPQALHAFHHLEGQLLVRVGLEAVEVGLSLFGDPAAEGRGNGYGLGFLGGPMLPGRLLKGGHGNHPEDQLVGDALGRNQPQGVGARLGSRVDLNGRHHPLPRDVLDLAPLLHPGRARLHPHHPTPDGAGVGPEGAGPFQVPALDLDLHTGPRLPAQGKDVDDFRIGGLKLGSAGSGLQNSRQQKGENHTTAIPCSLSPESHALASMVRESGGSIPEWAASSQSSGGVREGTVNGKKISGKGYEEPRSLLAVGSKRNAVGFMGQPLVNFRAVAWSHVETPLYIATERQLHPMQFQRCAERSLIRRAVFHYLKFLPILTILHQETPFKITLDAADPSPRMETGKGLPSRQRRPPTCRRKGSWLCPSTPSIGVA